MSDDLLLDTDDARLEDPARPFQMNIRVVEEASELSVNPYEGGRGNGAADTGRRSFATKRDVMNFIEYTYGQLGNKTLVQDKKYKGSTSVRYLCDSCTEFCVTSNKSRPANLFLISNVSKLHHGSYDAHGQLTECKGVYRAGPSGQAPGRGNGKRRAEADKAEAERRTRRVKCPRCEGLLDDAHDAVACASYNVCAVTHTASRALLSLVDPVLEDSL